MENHIKKIMNESGFYFESDNRNSSTRAVNTCIDNGKIFIEVCEKGYFWYDEGDKSKKYNVVIRGFGYRRRYHQKTPLINSMASQIAKFLQSDKVNQRIGVEYKAHQKCIRCSGRGIIPQYSYWCNGVCFGCYGSGYESKASKLKM